MALRNRAAIVDYQVIVGPYAVGARMLNLADRVFEHLTSSIGEGSFGSIIPLVDEKDEYVAKRIRFTGKMTLAFSGK